MNEISAETIAEAFGFASPIGPLELMRQRGAVATWRVNTGADCMLVKRFWHEDELPWRAGLEEAMELEQLAVHVGIHTPTAVIPARPVFGSVARINGHGLFRAFPYIEHRRLSDDDDISEWVGATLAHIHQLRGLAVRPDPHWWYGQAPPVPQAQWLSWLDDGERTGMSWAPALREHLDLVLEQARQVVETFNASPPYAISHRDVEPWNVLMTEGAGRTTGQLDRIIGRHLASITTALGGYFDGGHSADQIRERIENLPTVAANVHAWERLLDNATTLE